mmetsp:Transcript_146036/g.364156  ORF Transcript_146036/g.364156 Transcript_146036/m.364156 type:complete len:365 (+) Transcript_146036:248-1342(+)
MPQTMPQPRAAHPAAGWSRTMERSRYQDEADGNEEVAAPWPPPSAVPRARTRTDKSDGEATLGLVSTTSPTASGPLSTPSSRRASELRRTFSPRARPSNGTMSTNFQGKPACHPSGFTANGSTWVTLPISHLVVALSRTRTASPTFRISNKAVVVLLSKPSASSSSCAAGLGAGVDDSSTTGSAGGATTPEGHPAGVAPASSFAFFSSSSSLVAPSSTSIFFSSFFSSSFFSSFSPLFSSSFSPSFTSSPSFFSSPSFLSSPSFFSSSAFFFFSSSNFFFASASCFCRSAICFLRSFSIFLACQSLSDFACFSSNSLANSNFLYSSVGSPMTTCATFLKCGAEKRFRTSLRSPSMRFDLTSMTT